MQTITDEGTRAQLLLKCSLLTLLFVEGLIHAAGERWPDHLAHCARFAARYFYDGLAELLGGIFDHSADNHFVSSYGFIFHNGGASFTAKRGSSRCRGLGRRNHFAVLHLIGNHSLFLTILGRELPRLFRCILSFADAMVAGDKFCLLKTDG